MLSDRAPATTIWQKDGDRKRKTPRHRARTTDKELADAMVKARSRDKEIGLKSYHSERNQSQKKGAGSFNASV